MRFIAKVFEFITGIITMVVVILILAWIIPQKMGIKPFIVKSGSMEPIIPTGAVAFIDTNDTDVEVGDIVTYIAAENETIGTGNGQSLTAEDGTLITHRIVDMDGDMFITKGDNNDVIDLKEVSQSQIMGTYKYNIPRAGYIFANFEKKLPMILITWIGGMNLLSILLMAITEPDKEESGAKETGHGTTERKTESDDSEAKADHGNSEAKAEPGSGTNGTTENNPGAIGPEIEDKNLKAEPGSGNEDDQAIISDENGNEDEDVVEMKGSVEEEDSSDSPKKQIPEDEVDKEKAEPGSVSDENSEDKVIV